MDLGLGFRALGKKARYCCLALEPLELDWM